MAMTERDVLDYFWQMARLPDVDRLALLGQAETVVLPSTVPPLTIRETAPNTTRRLTEFKCFVCRTGERRLYWHHVVTVAHGGSNEPGNLVRLCHACHRSVHKWLPEPTSRERRGWTRVGDLAGDALERLADIFSPAMDATSGVAAKGELR